MTHTIAAKDRPGYGKGREALLDAAIHVVAQGGLRNLTYRAVAAQAGVTHGLVAHHFGSRDALLEEALNYSLQRSLDTAPMDPASGSLEDLAAGLAQMVARDPDVQAFEFELVLESRRRPEIRPIVEKLYEGYREAGRRGAASVGITDSDVGELIFAALDGIVFQQVAFGDAERTERLVQSLRQILIAQFGDKV